MDEVEQIEEELRAALLEADAGWLLDQVDLAIAEGRAVVRPKGGGQESIAAAFDRKDVEITAAPYSATERVALLLGALRTALVEAPQMVDEINELVLGELGDRVEFVSPATGERERSLPNDEQLRHAREAAHELDSIVDELEDKANP